MRKKGKIITDVLLSIFIIVITLLQIVFQFILPNELKDTASIIYLVGIVVSGIVFLMTLVRMISLITMMKKNKYSKVPKVLGIIVSLLLLLNLAMHIYIKVQADNFEIISMIILGVTVLVFIIFIILNIKIKNTNSIKEVNEGHAMICTKGEYEGGKFGVKETIVIGKDRKLCQLIINDESVSRKHALVSFDEDKKMYVVVDYSKNGTYVLQSNEQYERLEPNKPYYLPVGTKIALGKKNQVFLLS